MIRKDMSPKSDARDGRSVANIKRKWSDCASPLVDPPTRWLASYGSSKAQYAIGWRRPRLTKWMDCPAPSTAERDELSALRRAVRTLRQQRDILTRATSLLAREATS